MKKSFSLKAFLVILTLILISSFAGCSSEDVSLINGDFEKGANDTGGVVDWYRSDYYGNMEEGNPFTKFSVVTDGYEGKAVCIENMQKNDARIYQHIDSPTDSKYKITAMVKTEGVTEEGAGANISVKGFAGTSDRVIGDSDWQELIYYVNVTDVSEGFDVCLSLGGYSAESIGKAYFDNVKIEKVKAIPADASSVTVWDSTKAQDTEETEVENEWLNNLFKFMFVLVILGLVVYAVILSNKTDVARYKKKMSLSVSHGKPDKWDWLIILVMTVIVIVVSFVNLGDTKAASDYWRAQKDGDYVIVEFEEETRVNRYSYSTNIPSSGSYTVYYENSEGVFVEIATITQGTFFEWSCTDTDFTTKKVKVEAKNAGLAINEVAFFNQDAEGNWQLIPVEVVEEVGEERGSNGTPACLFNEQDAAASVRTYMNGTYFDEIYHARTGYEHVNGLSVYETTHPPLGKLLIGLGIKIFGMNPFGWRFMGTLLGTLFVPLMYLFALKIFKKRLYAFSAAFLMMFDFMRFTQTRIATIDTYSVLFVLLMYYYMYDYFTTKTYDLKFVQSLKPLALSGLFFGIGVASKWTSMYAGAGLAFLFFLAKYLEYQDIQKRRYSWPKEKKSWLTSDFLVTCAFCVIVFVVIPAIIYTLCYIPYKPGEPDKDLITIMLDNQVNMFNYHSNLNATHSFSSTWWQWPILYRPIWYYLAPETGEGLRSTISSFGNPAIWWTGIGALVMSVIVAWKKRDKKMVVVFVAVAMQFCPWMLVTRCTFIYHFFTSVPFVILMIIYCAKYIIESKKITPYNGAAIAAFISGPVMLLSFAFFPTFVPMSLIVFAFSIVSFLMERYGNKDIVRILVPIGLALVTAVLVFTYVSVAFVTGALLVGYVVDMITRIKHKSAKGIPMLIYYLAVVAGLFIAFFPVMSGMTVSNEYIEELKWFPSWVF